METFIYGHPKAQPRPRAFSRGGKARMYNPPSADIWKAQVAEGLLEYAHRDDRDPFLLVLTFYMPRPKSHYGTGRNKGKIKDNAPDQHTQKPDIDNLTKAVMDAITVLNVWRDDSQVVSVRATKLWSDIPEQAGVNLTIKGIDLD